MHAAVEPDDVAIGMVRRLALLLVAGTVLALVATVALFRWQTASELEAKGYDVEARAPAAGSR